MQVLSEYLLTATEYDEFSFSQWLSFFSDWQASRLIIRSFLVFDLDSKAAERNASTLQPLSQEAKAEPRHSAATHRAALSYKRFKQRGLLRLFSLVLTLADAWKRICAMQWRYWNRETASCKQTSRARANCLRNCKKTFRGCSISLSLSRSRAHIKGCTKRLKMFQRARTKQLRFRFRNSR
jgi:hypothetical protein